MCADLCAIQDVAVRRSGKSRQTSAISRGTPTPPFPGTIPRSDRGRRPRAAFPGQGRGCRLRLAQQPGVPRQQDHQQEDDQDREQRAFHQPRRHPREPVRPRQLGLPHPPLDQPPDQPDREIHGKEDDHITTTSAYWKERPSSPARSRTTAPCQVSCGQPPREKSCRTRPRAIPKMANQANSTARIRSRRFILPLWRYRNVPSTEPVEA